VSMSRKAKGIRWLASLITIFMLLSIVPVSYSSAENDVVSIPDPNLEQAIRDELNKPVGDITTDDMAEMTSLLAIDRGIENLTGLEYAVNLTGLDFSNNQVSDLSPLQNLTSLTELYFGGNQVSDISPLQNLTNLRGLRFSDNQVSDISALENLTNLEQFSFRENQVSDLSPVQNLTNLTGISFTWNQVSDLSPLQNLTNLTWLLFEYNQISDISALENLTNLTFLHFSDNQVSDISVLSNLTDLTGLFFSSNQVSDISALANLTNLMELVMQHNYLDISEGSYSMQLIQQLINDGVDVEYIPQREQVAPPTGAHRVAYIPVQYPAEHSPGWQPEPDHGIDVLKYKAEMVEKYFKLQTYGEVDIVSDFIFDDWVTFTEEEMQEIFEKAGISSIPRCGESDHGRLFSRAVLDVAIEKAFKGDLDISAYDQGAIVVINPIGGSYVQYLPPGQNHWPSFNQVLPDEEWPSTPDGRIPSTNIVWTSDRRSYGVWAHELGMLSLSGGTIMLLKKT